MSRSFPPQDTPLPQGAEEGSSLLKAYLCLTSSLLDSYHICLGASVLRCSLPTYKRKPSSRLFEPLLEKALGIERTGKERDARVKSAASFARAVQIRARTGDLSPEIILVIQKIEKTPFGKLTPNKFAATFNRCRSQARIKAE